MTRGASVGWTAAACAGVIASGGLLYHVFSFTTAIPIYLLPVLFVSWRLNLKAAVLVCIVSTLTLDFFFTAPRFALRVFSAQDVASLISFGLVALLVSHLSARERSHAADLVKRQQAQQSLYQLSQRSLLVDWRHPVAEQICRAVCNCFALDGVGIWEASEARFAYSGNAANAGDSLRAAFMSKRDYDLPSAAESIRILRSGVRPIGSLICCGLLPDAITMDSVATVVSSAMERAGALSAEVLAQSEQVSEQLRSSVLDGLAHSIKTPLTTISVSSAGIATIGKLAPGQQELLSLIDGQTDYLASLTDKLLRTARLDSSAVLKRRPTNILQLIEEAISDLGQDGPSSRVDLEVTGDPIVVSADADVLKMAIVQVLENALKYSPPESRVLLLLDAIDGLASIAVHNDGSSISPAEAPLVFRRFYRSPSVEHRAPGTGLGLSVAKQSVEAHGGQISLLSDAAEGTTFIIELPVAGGSHAGISTHR